MRCGDAPDRRVVDRIDVAHDLVGNERRAMDQHVLRHLLAARRGAFQGHQEPSFHLSLGTGQLDRREPIIELARLLAQYRQEFGRFLFPGAGIDAKQPAVAIGVRE